MRWHVRIVLGLLACAVGLPALDGREPPAKAKIELRWLETRKIEGVTEEKGFQSSDDPNDIVYPHKKAALVLTAAEVSAVQLTNLDLSKNGLSKENYTVTITLTKEARAKLAATTDGKETKLLTVTVDGRNWGTRRYEKDKNKAGVPEVARADTFTPSVGFISSKAEAQRIVDALK